MCKQELIRVQMIRVSRKLPIERVQTAPVWASGLWLGASEAQVDSLQSPHLMFAVTLVA